MYTFVQVYIYMAARINWGTTDYEENDISEKNLWFIT